MNQPAEPTVYRCDKGWLALAYPAPDLYFSWASGVVRLPTLHRVLSDLDAHMSRVSGKVHGFDDYSAVEGYHWDVRMHLFRWFTERRERVGHLTILVTSPSIRVAAGVLKLALGGGIEIAQDRAAFDARSIQALAKRGAARPQRPIVQSTSIPPPATRSQRAATGKGR